MAVYKTDANKNLIKVAGNFGGIKTKTLWTNPNPTSEFTPRTITLTDENLNIYSTIQIVYYNANYGNRYITTEIKPDGNTYEMSGVHSTGNTVFVYYRAVKASSNYIEFGDCWRGSNSGEVKTNNANIPVLIVGIKKSPDMTYIGTELFAGNGIKIDNGEISTSETIYDMSSNNSSLNWGYTSGFGNTTISSKNFSKYKELICYTTFGGTIHISLERTNSDGTYSGRNVSMAVLATYTHLYQQIITINSAKTSISMEATFFVNNTTSNDGANKIQLIKGVY